MKISILLPSRARPTEFKRMWESALTTADKPSEIEFVVYRDQDDTYDYIYAPNTKEFRGPRIVLSEMWNTCQKIATGDIYMHAGDDIVFQTKGWDTQVRQVFEHCPDRILFVFGDDGAHGSTFGTHGFVHKDWVKVVGYFVPPYFSSDFNDTWLNDVSFALGRKVYLPFVTEHMHWTFGKGPKDKTHEERIERHRIDNVEQIYASKREERERDVLKLRNYIANFK